MATVAAESARADAAAGHWPEYLIEAALLGLFMLSACSFAVLLDHPGSPAYRAIPDPFVRRLLGGLAMGATAIALIYSPWGRRSGAHFNPAATLAFLRVRRIAPRDATWYMGAQFVGMNPARTFASAIVAGDWTALWIYFTAPPLGMLAAAELHLRPRAGSPAQSWTTTPLGGASTANTAKRRVVNCDSHGGAENAENSLIWWSHA